MKKSLKTIILSLFILVMIAATTIPAFAYVPYNTYNYDFYGDTVDSPSGYVPEAIYLSEDLGISSMHSPNDIYVSDKNEIYVLDLGAEYTRGRLCIFDENFKLVKEFRSLIDIDGKPYYMKNPGGVTVDKNGFIYVCDTDNAAVLKITREGQIVLKYEHPGDDVFDDSYTYQPYKIVIGINGSAYVISRGCLDGILEFDIQGNFVRFFGAPKVQLSVGDYFEIYWRSIYRSFSGDEIDKYFVTFVPTEFENMDIDENGFIFTTVIANEDSIDEVSKLNFTGSNVLSPTTKSTKKVSDNLSKNYGDLKIRSKDIDNNFVDIVVDDDGFFSVLDAKLCKVFEYDAEGNLIFIYGGDGQQVGTMEKASAMAKLGKKTLVIDSTLCGIIVYDLSEYGQALHDAVVLYNKGLYADADPLWREVLLYNANSDIAHVGIGKVYYMNGEYANAMKHFKVANDRENYSRSYELYRKDLIRNNFGTFATIIVILLVVVYIFRKFGDKLIAKIKEKKGGVVNG